jgi:hypothetical protein
MYYKLVIILNNYKIEKSIYFNKNIYITKIYQYHNILDILFSTYNNIMRIILYDNDIVIFDTNDIILPKKLYKLYNFGGRKLYTYCLELDEFLIGIDIMKIYKIKYFSSFFIMRK